MNNKEKTIVCRSGYEPEVQIWFESERNPYVSFMPVYQISPMDEEHAATYADVVQAACADVSTSVGSVFL